MVEKSDAKETMTEVKYLGLGVVGGRSVGGTIAWTSRTLVGRGRSTLKRSAGRKRRMRGMKKGMEELENIHANGVRDCVRGNAGKAGGGTWQ